jgi:hypothetical protein
MSSQSGIKRKIGGLDAPETIRIAFQDSVSLEEEQSAFPTIQSVPIRTSDVVVQVFRDNLAKIVMQLQDALNTIDDRQSLFKLDEAQFHLTVSAEGELSLLAKVGGSFGAGIVITLKRKECNEQAKHIGT